MKVNKEKLKQVIHYIISKCDCKNNVGKTVLCKLLYFSDFDHYEVYEKSITNNTYYRFPQGPYFPMIENLADELIAEGKINVSRKFAFLGGDYPITSYSPLKDPDLSLLNNDELKVIDSVIDKLSLMNANEISEYSHGDKPWRVAKEGEELDYEFVFYRDEKYSVRVYDEDG